MQQGTLEMQCFERALLLGGLACGVGTYEETVRVAFAVQEKHFDAFFVAVEFGVSSENGSEVILQNSFEVRFAHLATAVVG